MDTDSRLEAFIPYPRQDIIKLCLEDGRLDSNTAEAFKSFCKILSAFYHFQFHSILENIKESYRVFNPTSDVQPLYEPALSEYEQRSQNLVKEFKNILERANYCPMPKETIQQALEERSLIDLKTDVNFEDFDQVLCYYRGDVSTTIPVRNFVFWKTEKTIDVLERLVLLIQFKGEGYFRAKDKRSQQTILERKFTPGKMYVSFYKSIPKLDLDLLFPNVQTSMTLRDRLMLVVPAIGAATPVVLKAIPNILLLVAAILLALNARSGLEAIGVQEEQVRNIMPVLVATLTLAIALGGFAAKQYSQYKTKKIKFQKDVTDTLFFKNLANNASVFQMLVDLAEEEECKEIILVCYHLLTTPQPLTPKALDAKIEAWMMEKTGAAINFDIHGPLQNLQSICSRTIHSEVERPLLEYDDQGCCKLLPLPDAKAVLDYIWDNAFC